MGGLGGVLLAVAWGVVPRAEAADVVCPPISGPSSAYHHWSCVERAKLLDALDGDAEAAVSRYTRLVHDELPAADPALSEALFWLAQTAWARGDVQAARSALDRCVQTGLAKARCTELRARIDLEAEGVSTVPVRWDFADTQHGFFHPRPYWDKGSIRIVAVAGQHWLAWSTLVDPLKGDQLVVGFTEPSPAPTRVVFRVRSVELTALLEVELIDTMGRRYTPVDGRIELAPGRFAEVGVDLTACTPVDPAAPPLDTGSLYRLVLHDATGLTGQAGRNEIHITSFEVR